MKEVKVASIQFEHKDGDKASNMKKIEEFVIAASKENVDIIVFPECCVTGYWFLRKLSKEELLALAENLSNSETSRELLALSKTYNMTIGVGLLEVDDDNNIYNTYLVAMPDGRVESHRKLHCFVSEHMSSGDEYTVFDTPQGCKLGVLVCYDNNIIENARMTALNGADIILAPHQTGGCKTDDPNKMGIIETQLWENRENDPESIEREFKGDKGRGWLLRWLPSRAHDNGVFYIFSNGVGKDDDEIRTGNAMILDTYGRILSETWKACDAMVISTLDPKLREHNTGRRWMTARRPSLYGPLAESTSNEVDIRTARFSGKGA
ncbi:MAG: acyltransferase [Lentisphaeria bacterium]|nr:nitrilase family protein [Lentisphaeria bacterium]NQZ69617.1 acyltransferase [Lentisphaeria bacterium]